MSFLGSRTSPRLVKPATREPLRQDLADAIADARTIDAQIAQALADRDKGERLQATCRERLDKAREAVAAAKETRSQRIMSAVETDQPIGPDTVLRDAIAVEQDELYALEVIEAGVARAAALIAEAQSQRDKATEKVKAAASQVLVINIGDLAVEIDRAHMHLIGLVRIMRFLAKHTLPGPGSFAEAYNIVNRFDRLPNVHDEQGGPARAVDPWKAAEAALMTDADAPLPDALASFVQPAGKSA